MIPSLNAALEDMAEFLYQRGVPVQLVTVGGAVNTLYLRSRQSTHDIDFFLENPSSPVHHIVHEAARYANRRRGGRLGAEWFNNATQLFMPTQLQGVLFRAAVEQGTIVFEHGEMRVYAAPWSYALCGKLNRPCSAHPRSYDLGDAVVYLDECLRVSGRQTLVADKVRQWCRQFNKNMSDEVLRRLDEAYFDAYGRRAIDWRA